MRKAALIGSFSGLLVAASVALAAAGNSATRVALAQATKRTAHVGSLRYALEVRITKGKQPLALHIVGASGPGTISVRLKMSDLRLPDGTVIPGPTGAELLDGPFLYERAPSNMVVLGTMRWLRVPVSGLSPASSALTNLHDMTPAPLLRVLGESHALATSPRSRVYAGPVAYDDPIVRTGLTGLAGGIEFRHLRVTAWVGRDGLVHRLRVTGRTADGAMSLGVDARFYAFGRPVTVTPPPPGTFMDRQLLQLAN